MSSPRSITLYGEAGADLDFWLQGCTRRRRTLGICPRVRTTEPEPEVRELIGLVERAGHHG
ncbi:hypothetical protein [Actinopolyspora lacussalsi]|uniref:hypothetical protein n=1 Tax=Actinopolyspora righensis TaxID=995060 RepID=UPI0011144795|nr:hypothetical protein [Actinopolyspora righensis]